MTQNTLIVTVESIGAVKQRTAEAFGRPVVPHDEIDIRLPLRGTVEEDAARA